MSQDNIIVLASGWSVAEQKVDLSILKTKGYVIGVNDSGMIAPCDELVSMDRLWLENRWDFLSRKKMKTWLRRSAYRVNKKDEPTWSNLFLFENDNESDEFSCDVDTLNGFNSGFCGLNRAYHRAPKKLFIFGFDHCKSQEGRHYWHEPYPWSNGKGGATKQSTFNNWSKKYEKAAFQFKQKGIEVFNVSPKSALNNFEKISYKEFLCAK